MCVCHARRESLTPLCLIPQTISDENGWRRKFDSLNGQNMVVGVGVRVSIPSTTARPVGSSDQWTLSELSPFSGHRSSLERTVTRVAAWGPLSISVSG